MAVVRAGIVGLTTAMVLLGPPVLASGDDAETTGTTTGTTTGSPTSSESASPTQESTVTEPPPETAESTEEVCATPEAAPATEPGAAGEAMYKRWEWLVGKGVAMGGACDEPLPVGAGYRWNFERGAIFWYEGKGAREVLGPILDRYDRLDGLKERLGFPTVGEIGAAVPGARLSVFQRGRIYWSKGTGAREVYGPILRRYVWLGAAGGRLGLPRTGVIDAAGAPSARQSRFQRGRIYWSKGTGAREVYGPILGRYARMGSAAGPLGLPVTGQIRAAGARGAKQNFFQRGRIYWSKGTGAHSVRRPILRRYRSLGYASGRLGLPTSQPYRVQRGVRQRFQDGHLLWDRHARRTFIRLPYFGRANRITAKDVPYTWRSGCPVGPGRLRMMRIVHRAWNGDDRVGRLVVRGYVVDDMRRVFSRAYRAGFTIRRMTPVDRWRGSDVRAMEADNTSAFNCRHVTGNPYRLSQHSYGNAIDINTVENPYVTSSRVYPSGSRTYLNRRWVRKGMIIGSGPIARGMRVEGWPWGARWRNPDYQHFSSNGG